MSLASLLSARVILEALLRDMGGRAKAGIAKLVLGVMAVSLLGSAGLVALAQVLGYPIAATIFAAFCAIPALAIHLIGRTRSRASALRFARAQDDLRAEVAVAADAARAVLPLLPLLPLVALGVALIRGRRR